MLKKCLSLVVCVVLLGNGFDSLTYAQSGRVSAHRDGTRNNLAKRGNTSPGNVSENAQGSSTGTLRESGKVMNDVRGGVGRISHRNNLSNKGAGIILLSGLVLAVAILATSGP